MSVDDLDGAIHKIVANRKFTVDAIEKMTPEDLFTLLTRNAEKIRELEMNASIGHCLNCEWKPKAMEESDRADTAEARLKVLADMFDEAGNHGHIVKQARQTLEAWGIRTSAQESQE